MLLVQGGEASDFTGVMSRLTGSEVMFVLLKRLRRGNVQAY